MMTRNDEDGDLAGTTPADNPGEHAALVARLRTSGTPIKNEAADVIEKLLAELATEVHAREQWFEVDFPHWLEERNKISARLARAEDCIEQVRHALEVSSYWHQKNGLFSILDAYDKKAASDD